MNPVYLTLLTASDRASNRAAIALPEWTGWWFMINGKIYVFTKDNQTIGTADIEQYGSREDFDYIDITEEHVVRFIKSQRQRLDAILVNVKRIQPNRELAIVATSIQNASMRLGKALGKLNAPNPYPESYNPGSPIIEKHADLSEGNVELITPMEGLDRTGFVKALRVELSLTQDFINWIGQWTPNAEAINYITTSKGYIEDAVLWLGQELNNIRILEEAYNERVEIVAFELYREYGKSTDFKNFKGDPMPEWTELFDKQKTAWKACAKLCIDRGYQVGMVAPNR